MKDYIIPAIVAVIVAAIVVFVLMPKPIAPPIGASSGTDHLGIEQFFGGMINKTQIASTSQGTAITVSAPEFLGWSRASMVSFSPGLAAGTTLTLPASSTIAAVVPNAGDSQTFCIRNATTTAATPLILAGGTGTNLLVASSSVSALGSKLILTGKVACLRLTREALTTTTFDIDALMTTFN
jgi:hypothetical protein